MLLLVAGICLAQIETVESGDFAAGEQRKAVTATVRVANPAQRKVGSGVVVARTGAFVYVLTAAHVVAGNRGLEVSTYNETDYPKAAGVYKDAKVLAASVDRADLAVLRFTAEDKSFGSRPLCSVETRPKADRFACLLAGCLDGEAPTVQVDRVAGTRKAKDAAGEIVFWECLKRSPEGRSGGAVINIEGRVVGICSGVSGGRSYFTHIDEIHRFLKKNALQWLAEEDE